MGLIDVLTGPVKALIGTLGGIVDDLNLSGEEKLAAKTAMTAQLYEFQTVMVQEHGKIVAEQASIIRTEAGSESWLTRSWRPITMLAFVALLFLRWFGLTPDNLSEAEVLSVFDIVKIGIGGYVVSRGVEKSVATWKNGSND